MTIEGQESFEQPTVPTPPVAQEAVRPQKRSHIPSISLQDNNNIPAPKKAKYSTSYMAPRKLHSSDQEPSQEPIFESNNMTLDSEENSPSLPVHKVSPISSNNKDSQLESIIPKVQHRASGLKVKRNRSQMAELLGISDAKYVNRKNAILTSHFFRNAEHNQAPNTVSPQKDHSVSSPTVPKKTLAKSTSPSLSQVIPKDPRAMTTMKKSQPPRQHVPAFKIHTHTWYAHHT